MYWRTIHIHRQIRHVISKAGNRYRKEVCTLLRGVINPIDTLVSVQLKLWFPDKRMRDTDNIQKPLLDALTHAGIWKDDWLVRQIITEDVGLSKPGYVLVGIKSFTYAPQILPQTHYGVIRASGLLGTVPILPFTRESSSEDNLPRKHEAQRRYPRGSSRKGRERSRKTVHWSEW